MAPITAHLWELGSAELRDHGNPHGQDMLLEGKAPKAGEIIKMPHLATTFKVRWWTIYSIILEREGVRSL